MVDKTFDILNEIDEPQDIEAALDTSAYYGNQKEAPAPKKEEMDSLTYESPAEKEIKAKKGTPWKPSEDVMQSLPEAQAAPAIYDAGEIIANRGAPINAADEALNNEHASKIADFNRQIANIEEAKARHHIKYLKIPEGELQTRFHIAAEDTDYQRAQAALDELLNLVETEYPYMIYAYTDDYYAETATTDEDGTIKPEAPVVDHSDMTEDEMKAGDIITVLINKRDADQLAWTEEEAQKIKRSRTIELKIVETKNLQLGNIEDVDDDAIDSVLSQYERKVNEVAAALPASHYRATFTGLTYAEVIDLSTAIELNNYDGERKKWSIAFAHIKNQTIGPWEEYKLYRDPNTKKMVKTKNLSSIPAEVKASDIHDVSKFEDFMRKTSYMDLDFILWKILCATTMGTEIVSVNCRKCKHSYDHIYRPEEMLQIESINPATLEEIKEVATADSRQKIMELYESGPVCNSNYVDLPNSGYKVIYGHISAYEYLTNVYSRIKELEDSEDPDVISKSYSYLMLPVIKSFLLPAGNGWKRVSGTDNILKVINSLDEVDYRVILEISRLAREPYAIKFAIPNVVCPNCKEKSDISIDDMVTLLFILARSLASVNVTLSST